MLDELSGDEVTGAVDRIIGDLLAAANVREPPVDAIRIAQRTLGITVCLDGGQQARGRAQRSGRHRQIYLRPEPIKERHQWTVAHEIGEHLKIDLLRALEIEPEQTGAMMGEALANLFAGRLLVPQAWLAADAPALHYDVAALRERYHSASHEVVGMRLLDLPVPCIITIIDNGHVYRRRSNAFSVNRMLEPPELICQEYVHRFSRKYRVQEAGWTVHGWPVHQVDWKREVLRSVVEASFELVQG
jgi:Zn-dependent peptidase ImmA (M78 family)